MLPPYTDPGHPPGLVARAQAGDEEAVAELWRGLNPALLRYLRGRIGTGAEDVAAQTWLDAARGLGDFEGGEAEFRRWLFTIARRRLIDEHRRRSRRPEQPVWPAPFEPTRMDAELDRVDDLANALALVRRLTPDQSDAVLLRVVADLDVAEVAMVMGRTENSVRVLVHRGVRRLQAILEEERRADGADGVTGTGPAAMYREP